MVPAPRYGLEYPVQVFVRPRNGCQKSPVRIRGKSRNLSLTGFGLDLPPSSPIEEGDVLVVQLELDSETNETAGTSISFQSQVVWNHRGLCGLRIMKAKNNSRAIYRDILEGYNFLSTVNALTQY